MQPAKGEQALLRLTNEAEIRAYSLEVLGYIASVLLYDSVVSLKKL
jgi:hypothetical protein